MKLPNSHGMDFSWEGYAISFYQDYWYVFATGAALYIPVVFGLKSFMENRKPFVLRPYLAAWNLILTIFSGLGMYYTIPILVNMLVESGFEEAVCNSKCWLFPEAQWVFYFNVSKLFEFVDTIFIVLRKRELIFLHWFHHIVTMLYCWYCNLHSHQFHCAGWWFSSINLAVHTVMYMYFFLAMVGYRSNWNFVLTAAQILQMVIGSVVVFQTTRCPQINWYEVTFGGVMYLSFLYLFVEYYGRKYLWGKPPQKANKPEQKNPEQNKTEQREQNHSEHTLNSQQRHQQTEPYKEKMQ